MTLSATDNQSAVESTLYTIDGGAAQSLFSAVHHLQYRIPHHPLLEYGWRRQRRVAALNAHQS